MSLPIEASLKTDIGMKRKQNQDSACILPNQSLFVVADGMGGHQGGETASQLCVEKVKDFFLNLETESQLPDQIQKSLFSANQSIFQLSESNPQLKGMGTTATVLKISKAGIAHIGQVGDSRAYYWNSQGLWQLTLDHSLVQEKLRAGLITREQLMTDDLKNVITRSVGYEAHLKVDLFSFPVQAGDGFLLCSDGLSNPLSDALIFDILDESLKSGLDLNETAQQLVDAANQRGGDDNITVVLVRIR